MKSIAIYGAGGHAKVVVDIAKQLGYTHIVLFDERWQQLGLIEACSVKGDWQALLRYLADKPSSDVHVAIGNNHTRLDKIAQLERLAYQQPVLVHPRAYVSDSASIGLGSVIMANATVSVNCRIGRGVIINHNSSVDHDGHCADGVHIAPGAHLAGEVSVGRASMLGIGSCIIQGIIIKADVIVGAGSVVVKDVKHAVKVYGNPAK
ncbi:acetyltransferase [Agarivorans sp. MS3-6]|uniref:acetyltransferase n=1 Tax=Agarivorans sp. TSD2052 TaxID=2937286 RepID=UPI00200D9A06|nr:acetyltransferase [Agarivorans sp. TSD2052]UPW20098.1 acetyltransferase [Agarivorans sp. TSD2052]